MTVFPPETNNLLSALGPTRKLHPFATCKKMNCPSVLLEQAAPERQHRVIFRSTDKVGPEEWKGEANLGSVT